MKDEGEGRAEEGDSDPEPPPRPCALRSGLFILHPSSFILPRLPVPGALAGRPRLALAVGAALLDDLPGRPAEVLGGVLGGQGGRLLTVGHRRDGPAARRRRRVARPWLAG